METVSMSCGHHGTTPPPSYSSHRNTWLTPVDSSRTRTITYVLLYSKNYAYKSGVADIIPGALQRISPSICPIKCYLSKSTYNSRVVSFPGALQKYPPGLCPMKRYHGNQHTIVEYDQLNNLFRNTECRYNFTQTAIMIRSHKHEKAKYQSNN